ncbi:MAG TPA: NUDIX hydrolase [Thiotrichales bacterium]|nr:NUDIX hydrolase [Thiotrichales bacterium]
MIWKPHATVAAIIEREGKFLMVEELIEGEKIYNQPAGHLDPDENLIDAVIRETREETAWQFTPEALTGIYLWQHPENAQTFLRVAFCGQCHNHNADQPLDEGVLAAHWLSLDEIKQQRLRSPMVIKNIEDYLAGKRYPLELLVDMQGG